jgi:hypothetical protein
MWLIILVLGGIAVYAAWPDIMDAARPRQPANEDDRVVEGLRKVGDVYTGRNDDYYHCVKSCPRRIGGTASPVPRQKAAASGYKPCRHCCDAE